MALLLDIPFTDPQGMTFTAATFGVSYASRNTNENVDLRRDMADMETMTENVNGQVNVNVQFYYWADEAKRLEGKSPYILANMNDGTQPPTMSFNFVIDDVAYDGMTLEQQCLHYLQNVILV